MASNHTKNAAETDLATIGYLWDKLSPKTRNGVDVEQAKVLAKRGLISISNLLEEVILDNNKNLVKSNADGEDYTDKSDAKYLTARPRSNSATNKNGDLVMVSRAVLPSKTALKTKKGALRIFVTQIDPVKNTTNYRMFLLPYPKWKSLMTTAGIEIAFSCKTGELTASSQKRWGQFEVKSIKELAA
jgi:hypothetical protein